MSYAQYFISIVRDALSDNRMARREVERLTG
jgi:hypothetical protein